MFTGPGTKGDYMNVYIPSSFPCYTDELGTARDFIWNARVSTVNHTQKIKWSILLGSKLCQTELGLLVWVVGGGEWAWGWRWGAQIYQEGKAGGEKGGKIENDTVWVSVPILCLVLVSEQMMRMTAADDANI